MSFLNFPYTDTHQLNLDWIIKKVQSIPTKISQLINDMGLVNASEAAAAAPVQSVNNKTGAVSLDAADVGALPDSYTAPVSSVNGKTGAVSLDAADVGALPDSYTAPVSSVNGKTGTVSLDAADVGALPDNTNVNNVDQILRTASSYTNWRPLLVGQSINSTETGDFSDATGEASTFNNIRVHPSSGTVKATTFKGALTGTATTAYQIRAGNKAKANFSDKTYRYRLMFTSADNTTLVPANTSSSSNATAIRSPNTRPINPFGPIYYYNSTSTVEAGSAAGATTLYTQMDVTLGYSFNNTGVALTMTAKQPVYIIATPQNSGGAILEGFTQTLPSTEDGKIYIFLGWASSATTVELVEEHPVYYYYAEAIRLYTQAYELPSNIMFRKINISGGASGSFTINKGERGVIFTTGGGITTKEILLFNVTTSGTLSQTAVINSADIGLSYSDPNLTVSNANSLAISAFLMKTN